MADNVAVLVRYSLMRLVHAWWTSTVIQINRISEFVRASIQVLPAHHMKYSTILKRSAEASSPSLTSAQRLRVSDSGNPCQITSRIT